MLEDVKRMLIKAHFGHHYVIIDRGACVLYGPDVFFLETNLLSDILSAETLISSQFSFHLSSCNERRCGGGLGNDPRSALLC